MTDTFFEVCENFKSQSMVCRSMGSPFYADLLIELGHIVAQNRDSAIGLVFSNWLGVPRQDAVALRLIAALHYLVITKSDTDLQAIFPPLLSLRGDSRKDVLGRAIKRHQAFIIDYIKSPPQTNEVGRSIVLLGGFLELAKRFGAELDIFEVGASAGLNMNFDQYFYQCDTWQWGDPNSRVHFKPNWEGDAPPLGPLNIQNRKACDLSPIDAANQKNRLLSYVWPDQIERAQRINCAIDYAAKTKPNIEAMEASKWLIEQSKDTPSRPRVFYHSIIWQYFKVEHQERFTATMEEMGQQANDSSPLAWMRLEPSSNRRHAELRVTTWPDTAERHLADCGYHGEWVRWHAG